MSPPRGSHQRLSSASQPSSPVEEDLAQASAWDDTSTLVSRKSKGKGKQRVDDDDEEDDDDSNTVNGDSVQRDAGKYPPMAGEELEARKVEENLKRWETLEKQRRKQARDLRSSSRADSPSSSYSAFSVGDVSRRASQLWKGRLERSRPRNDPMHPHQVLEDVEESVPMDETGPPSAISPPNTPRTSDADTVRSFSTDPFRTPTENPFENPQYVEVRQDSSSILTAASSSSSSLPSTQKSVTQGRSTPEQPILQVEDTMPRKNLQPLSLPPSTKPPQAPPGTALQRQELVEEAEGAGKRWWTEWLCGCREDEADQAGHTNPME